MPTFNAGNGITYFNLMPVYIACAVAPGVGTVAGVVNVPTSCTVEAIGTQTNGGMVTATLVNSGTVNTLYTFPSTFVNLKSVNFLLTATAATSDLTVVDFDDTIYTVSKACT
ncbi:hypothetical protein OEA41_002384 [Lepraria neglecta]|uniref:Uncharacterized protein n=1 Tax=Lepraria neglecta TaxID=209136 RepID=A0AAD9ZEQ1_9LECA|nr:hypothetical protein OEA41_002384 [Lepraria neglecta]